MSFFYGSPPHGTSQFRPHTFLGHKIAIVLALFSAVVVIPLVAHAINSAPNLGPFGITSGFELKTSAINEQNNITPIVSTINEQPSSDTQPDTSGNVNQTSVSVNGESIDVPTNGTVSSTITTPDGNTAISVQVQNNSSSAGTAKNRSSLKVRTNTTSRESSSTQTNSSITNQGELQP